MPELVPGLPAVLRAETCFSARDAGHLVTCGASFTAPSRWGLTGTLRRRVLKSLQAPGTAPAEKPCSTLPPDQGPGRVLCSSHKLVAAASVGPAPGPSQSPRLAASAQTRAPLPLPPPPAPAVRHQPGWRQRRHGSDYCMAGSDGGSFYL